MNPDEYSVKQQLDEELMDIHFTRTAQVLAHTHPATRWERINALWNKEIELPLVPLGLASVLLFTWAAIQAVQTLDDGNAHLQERQLIEAGGNMYWKDDLEKVVARYENPNKS